MIDIHSHILPGLDDGARTLEESLAMLRLAVESGTTDIVATPHISPDFPNSFDAIERSFAQLAESANGIIGLHLGCDFHLTYDNLQDFLALPRKYTINGLRYLMVELPEWIPFGPVTEALLRIVHESVTPVITHPERNTSLQQNGRELAAWVARGCVTQVTGQSLLGRFGSRAKAASLRFLADGLVHVIASDGHDLVNRPPTMKSAHDFIAANYGPERADLLCLHNPGAILRGEPVKPAARPGSFWARLLQRRPGAPGRDVRD